MTNASHRVKGFKSSKSVKEMKYMEKLILSPWPLRSFQKCPQAYSAIVCSIFVFNSNL